MQLKHEAFKVNSIDYLLKPIKKSELERALNKFKKWSRTEIAEYILKLTQLLPSTRYQDKLLIPLNDKLLPIDLQDVSFFYTTDRNTSVALKNDKNIPIFEDIGSYLFYFGPSALLQGQ